LLSWWNACIDTKKAERSAKKLLPQGAPNIRYEVKRERVCLTSNAKPLEQYEPVLNLWRGLLTALKTETKKEHLCYKKRALLAAVFVAL
jgi:hypothetical protein